MPQVLTTNALIQCPHGGVGTTIPTSPTWFVNGGIVLLEGDTGTLACPFILCPCIGYNLKSMGLNATTVNGRRVILATDFNQTLTGLPLVMQEFHQTFDETSPAPLPAGQSSQTPSPAMADTVKPIVVPIPPVLAFNSMTMMPPLLNIVFNLSSPFPLQWNLTLLNGTTKMNFDITNGMPPAIVAPMGGVWGSPNLTVSVTLNAVFMAGLGVGMHHFCMTGVNQRGLSGFAECILTVS